MAFLIFCDPSKINNVNILCMCVKVKSQTENYVNNTGQNLGTMEGQVEGLTDRMVDVDSTLNSMVGQLSLVVQEFNQVCKCIIPGALLFVQNNLKII